jgi:hypothetical protein
VDYNNNWTELHDFDPYNKACEVSAEAPRDRYTLGSAMRIVRRMETSATRGAVFDEIKRKNAVYALVDWLYSKADTKISKPSALFLYMLKCALSVGPEDAEKSEAIAVANFHNERHTVDRLAAMVPGKHILQLSLDRSNLFHKSQLQIALSMVRAGPRIWPYLSRLAKMHSFMPAARIASSLAFYIRFSQYFAQYPRLKAAIVASNYSPEALGLAAAAHRAGRKVVYINHAPVPANGALVPPVLADCAVFYGRAIEQTYQRNSRCHADVALIGQPGTARPMEWRAEIKKIGIFLTALTRPETVAALVAAISETCPETRILVRNHPVGLLKSDFSDLLTQHQNLEITIGNPLDDEITACDLIFCGNSGVAMNVLRGGRPVAYLASLDQLNFDYNGFVEQKLVYAADGWAEDLYFKLQNFYASAAWRSVMQSYDASYGADKMKLEQAASMQIMRYLS